MRIAVAGGTGLTGRLVVGGLEAAGHTAVVLARSTGVDLTHDSQRVDEMMTGVDAVIDTSNLTTMKRARSEEFFGAVTATVLRAAERAGVGHHVALSIVGSDRVEYGYYAGKRVQESLIRQGNVPWTILRATQFHEFTEQTLGMTKGPLAVIPVMRSQPIAVREVADRLVELAVAPARRSVVEIAGPRVEHQPDLARRLLRARGSRRLVIPVRIPGAGGRGMADGSLLPTDDGPRGRETFTDWLSTTATPARG